MKTISINLYSVGELSEAALERALHEHSIFLNEVDSEGREFSVTETRESIEANDYFFFADGSLAHCTMYVGKHKRAGQTDFKLNGEIYPLI